MRFIEITESKVFRDLGYPIIENPTSQQFLRFIKKVKYQEVRGLVYRDKVWIWEADKNWHHAVQEYLGEIFSVRALDFVPILINRARAYNYEDDDVFLLFVAEDNLWKSNVNPKSVKNNGFQFMTKGHEFIKGRSTWREYESKHGLVESVGRKS